MAQVSETYFKYKYCEIAVYFGCFSSITVRQCQCWCWLPRTPSCC